MSNFYSWQKKQWQLLCGATNNQKLPHALLFGGVKGLGKFNFALAFARKLLCDSSIGEDPACGQCKACQLLAAGSHPDFRHVGLEEKSQAIKIDQIRELVIALGKTPQIGQRHCVIIDPADVLNVNAANALLKLLEEPPGDAVFILISHRLSRLPATIRSRCQKLMFSVPTEEQGLEWLREEGYEPNSEVLSQANGAPLLARSFLESDYDLSSVAEKCLVGVLNGHLNVVEAATELAQHDGLSTIDFFLDLAHKMATNRYKLGDRASSPLGQLLDRQPNSIETTTLFKLNDKLNHFKTQLLSTANPNKQLLWEDCLLDWQAWTRAGGKRAIQTPKVTN